jgi:hypothetical protein
MFAFATPPKRITNSFCPAILGTCCGFVNDAELLHKDESPRFGLTTFSKNRFAITSSRLLRSHLRARSAWSAASHVLACILESAGAKVQEGDLWLLSSSRSVPTIIDVRDGSAKHNMSVLISGDRISVIGSSKKVQLPKQGSAGAPPFEVALRSSLFVCYSSTNAGTRRNPD